MPYEPAYIQLTVDAASRRFVVLHWPAGESPPVGMAVHAPAFAEEMNKSRRMVALQARDFARAGVAVLIPDLFGCGDSPGKLADASWSGWIRDLVHAQSWLRAECTRRWPEQPRLPCALWGLRAGALLAVAAAREIDEECDLLTWQPALQGRSALHQFLRLLSAGEMIAGQAKGEAAAARAALAAGDSWEITGYHLPAAVAAGLETAAFEPPPTASQLIAFELSNRDEPSLSPALATAAARWQAAGWNVRTEALRGPSFWQTTEIEDAPQLISATSASLLAAWATRGQGLPRPRAA